MGHNLLFDWSKIGYNHFCEFNRASSTNILSYNWSIHVFGSKLSEWYCTCFAGARASAAKAIKSTFWIFIIFLSFIVITLLRFWFHIRLPSDSSSRAPSRGECYGSRKKSSPPTRSTPVSEIRQTLMSTFTDIKGHMTDHVTWPWVIFH